MRRLFLLTILAAVSSIAFAQQDSIRQDSTLQLKEVEVKAARVVTRSDGTLYMPSVQQKESSTNGYSLLNKLSMPMIRVDEVKHSVSSVDNKGVQIRLNGTLTTMADLLSLDPKLIRNVEFINNPGVRYGDDIGYVINIRTRRADDGYTVGADLTNALTTWYGSDMVYARWNHKNSEWGLTYDFGYNDSRHTRYSEKADYLLNDGSHYYINRQDSARRDRSFSNNIQLKYNLADSVSYVFQATLTGDFNHSPTSIENAIFSSVDESNHNRVSSESHASSLANGRVVNEEGVAKSQNLILKTQRNKRFSPVLDLYYYHTLGSHQSITANIVGTSIATDQYQYNNEGTEYAYNVDGNTWSLTSEAIYENKLKPFVMSFGINHLWKYTRNIYSGDAESTNNMHNSNLYLFGQIKGSLHLTNSDSRENSNAISYTFGLGISNVHYRQPSTSPTGEGRGGASFNYNLFRPKATLSYNLQPFNLTYSFEVSQHISQIAMISDTRIRANSLEWTVGNPDIKPNSVITHAFRLAFSKPRLYSLVYAEYRINRNCNMASYERTADNQFLYMQKNQPHVNMFDVSNSTSWTVLPDKLTAVFDGGIYRFLNKGDNYDHCLTTYFLSGGLQAYLDKWTLTAVVDNGWKFMEGETKNHQGFGNAIRCSYRFGNCNISLTWYHPFEAHPRTNYAKLVNRYIHKDMQLRSGDDGNSVYINFSWKLNRGHKYKDIERTMQNKDTQTGIL